jgi:hypothetical protein
MGGVEYASVEKRLDDHLSPHAGLIIVDIDNEVSCAVVALKEDAGTAVFVPIDFQVTHPSVSFCGRGLLKNRTIVVSVP